MKQLWILAVLALLPVVLLANTGLEGEVDAELDQMYQSATQQQPVTGTTAPSVQVNVQAQPQQQQMAAPAVQKQPTTLIEASPLTESRAEKMRRARQESELQTEQKIVEKLEQSRMEDEKQRAEVLFGDKFSKIEGGTPDQAAAAPVAVAPVPVVVADPGMAPKDSMDKEAVKQEITSALDALRADEEAKKKAGKLYFTALAGMGEYIDADNVKGNYSLGFAVGQKYQDRLLVEGSFLYGNYHVEQKDWYPGNDGFFYPRITNMDQYSAGMALKYHILTGYFRPLLGVTAQYTYRTFSDLQFGYANNDATSHAVDLGAIAGAELEFSDGFALGLDFRYMWNMTNRTTSGRYQQSLQQVFKSDVEKKNQMSIMLTGRATF